MSAHRDPHPTAESDRTRVGRHPAVRAVGWSIRGRRLRTRSRAAIIGTGASCATWSDMTSGFFFPQRLPARVPRLQR